MKQMKEQKQGRRARRSFTPQFKADAVRLTKSGKTIAQVARELDLTETALREWVRRAEADAGERHDVLTTEERDELTRLRRENKQLRQEREILKAAALHSTGRGNTLASSLMLEESVEDGTRTRYGAASRPLATVA